MKIDIIEILLERFYEMIETERVDLLDYGKKLEMEFYESLTQEQKEVFEQLFEIRGQKDALYDRAMIEFVLSFVQNLNNFVSAK